MHRTGIVRARAFRRAPTDAERKLWQALRDRKLGGLKFRRQVPIGRWTADFLCAELRLVVEVDGGQHGESARDALRDAELTASGYRTVRFWNNDVLGNLDGVLGELLAILGRPADGTAAPRPDAPPTGTGDREDDR